VAGAAAGTIPGAVLDVHDVPRQGKTRGWVAVYQQIDRRRLSRVLADGMGRRLRIGRVERGQGGPHG